MTDAIDDFIGGDEFDPEVAQRVENAEYESQVEDDSAVVAHVQRTKEVYTRLFVNGNATPDDVDFVMRDLAWFTKAHDPQWHPDPRMQDRFVARREVYQRILEYSRLDSDTLAKRYIETQN